MKKSQIIELIIKELNNNSFIESREIYANNIDFELETKNDYKHYETEQFFYNLEDLNFSGSINIFDYDFEREVLEVYDYTKKSEGNLQYFTLKELDKAAEFVVRSIKDKEFQINEEYNQIEEDEEFDFDEFFEDIIDEAIDNSNLRLLETILVKRLIEKDIEFLLFKNSLKNIVNEYNSNKVILKINSDHDLSEVVLEFYLDENNFSFRFD